MALSGNFSGKTSNQFVKPTIYWSAVQNLLENYSDVTVELRYSRTNTGYTTEGNFSGALYIDKGTDGEQKQTGTKSSFKVTYKSNSLAMSKTFRVNHSSNGSKKITISATGSIPPSSVTSTTISQEVELDTIPRASTIGATDANIGSVSMIVVTKKNTAYKHSISYGFGALSGWLKADGSLSDAEVIFSETNIAFAVPESFYGQIPENKSGKCILTCKTYYGSAQTGDAQTAEFAAVAAESVCAPSVSGTVVDVNETTKALTEDENVLVRYHSKAKCTITASAKNSASLISKTVNGKAIGSTLEIPNIETGSFSFSVKDSRGYRKTAEVKKTLIPYIKLTANATVKRTDPTSGRAILTVKGNFYNGDFGAEENSLTLGCQVGSEETVTLTPVISGNTYTASAELAGLAYDQTFPVTVTARDKLETVTASLTLQKGIPTFDFGENDFQFNVPVFDRFGTEMANGVVKYDDGKIDPDTTLEPLILTGHANGPKGADWYFYITTVFDHNKSTSSPRFQLAEPYGSAGSLYWRRYYDSTWGEWARLTNESDLKYLLNLDFITDGAHTIQSGEDVNDYLTPGAYRCPSAAVAETLENGPPRKDTGFRLIVSAQSSTYGVIHIAILNTSYTEIYIRTMTTTDTWGEWVRLTHSGERKIAYEFPNQTSTFKAQTVKPSGYANYDAMIVCARLSTGTAIEVPPVLIRKGGNGANLYGVLSGKIVRRTVTFTDAGIEFTAAGQISTYGGSFSNLNTSLIPTVMYGLKGVV